jgi:hypothetical protein
MKIKTFEVLLLLALLALSLGELIDERRERVILETPAPVIVETQPAPVVIEQTAAPVYDIQVIEPAPGATATEASRAGWQAPTVQTGNTGSHNPGRTDERSP